MDDRYPPCDVCHQAEARREFIVVERANGAKANEKELARGNVCDRDANNIIQAKHNVDRQQRQAAANAIRTTAPNEKRFEKLQEAFELDKRPAQTAGDHTNRIDMRRITPGRDRQDQSRGLERQQQDQERQRRQQRGQGIGL